MALDTAHRFSVFVAAHRPSHDEPLEPQPGSLPVEPDQGAIPPVVPAEDPQGEPVSDPKP